VCFFSHIAPAVRLRNRLQLIVCAVLLLPSFTFARPLSEAAQRGRQLMIDGECNRCHDVSDVTGRGYGIEPAEEDVHCVRCHITILATRGNEVLIKEKAKTFPLWRQYLANIVHLTDLPDLGTLTRRVDPAFVRRFLDAPFDLRPSLEESMIPVRLTEGEKDIIVRFLSELNGERSARKPSKRADVYLYPAAVPHAIWWVMNASLKGSIAGFI
jgi:hypothetical protein